MKRDSTVVPVPRRADVRAFPASRALILAAGKGSRLVQGRPYPKPLETVAGVPMIVRVIRGLKAAGVREVGVVIGHLGDVLRTELDSWDLGVTISYFENDEVDKPNGTSVLKAADIPSVLVEVGFLSTAADLDNLQDPIWRAGMAAGIRDGITDWALEDAALARLRRQ